MKEIILSILFLILFAFQAVYCQEEQEKNVSVVPVLSETFPAGIARLEFIDSPQEVINFLESKGLDLSLLENRRFSGPMKRIICSICNDCCDEFALILKGFAMRDPDRYKVYVLRLGGLYWSFFA